MPTFLSEIASHVIKHHGNHLHEVELIIPSKRAALFLKNEFKKQLPDTYFMPEIITINDFVTEYTSLNTVDSNTLLFEFYHVYTSLAKEVAEPFDGFIKWAPSLLSDFAEVDRYMVDASAIFSDLRNIKEIENWSFNSAELTEQQKNYLEFWNSIYPMYVKLHAHLEQHQLITSGRAYRLLAENIEHIGTTIPFKKLYFIGFNALSESEKHIIKVLQSLGKAEIIFDIDDYYLNIYGHEAGHFYKKLSKELNVDKEWVKSNTEATKKTIQVISAPNDLSQAQVVSTILNANGGELQNSDSAIVLSDQNLLLPILEELPELVESTNITMGYPPKLTLTLNLFELLFRLHENSERYSSKEVHRFHFSDVFNFLEHPIIGKFLGDVSSFKEYCVKRNISFVNFSEIEADFGFQSERIQQYLSENALHQLQKIKTALGFVFERWNDNATHPLKTFFELAEALKKSETLHSLQKEALFIVWTSLQQIKEVYAKYPFLNTSNYFKKIYRSYVNSEQIDLIGEPLKGLQIIGMLETRLIDYKNLIITSVNEGILPKSKKDNAIIPYDLKRHYKLPTYKEQDAIYAYYFYRLLHRSENVWIIYNKEVEGFSSGEHSRYVLQLQHEFPDTTKLSFKDVQQDSSYSKPIEIDFYKDDFYYTRLDYLVSEKGLSPSALNTWLTCPKDFYIKYILGIREQEEIEEEIGDNVLGTVIHAVLEQLYTPFLNQYVTHEHLSEFRKQAEKLLEQAFVKEYSRFYKTGKNYISFNVAKRLIDEFLQNEQKQLKKTNAALQIKSLEMELNADLNLTLNVGEKLIKLRGYADRVDTVAGVYRVSDYKTGKVETNDVTIKALNEVVEKSKALQLFAYGFMFLYQHPEIEKVSSQIIKMRDIYNVYYPLNYLGSEFIYRKQMADFESILTDILNEMYDKDFPLSHKEKATYCLMCS
jgi:ATP-dependent helicase/nuclease subunit B